MNQITEEEQLELEEEEIGQEHSRIKLYRWLAGFLLLVFLLPLILSGIQNLMILFQQPVPPTPLWIKGLLHG